MKKKKYDFTSYDLEYRRKLEKERGGKISDEVFYKYILKLRKWMKEYIGVVKKWVNEKPEEARQFVQFVKSLEERDKNKELYDKLAEIKKLSVAGLLSFLKPLLEKEGYIKLDFSKPEIDRGVIVPFTVQDNKTDRVECDSGIQLQRVLKKNLEATNWRLMSEGVSYRLGILTGRLRGYESEEDLFKLIKK